MNFAGNLVKAIDLINSNVWAFLVLCIGAFLSVHNHGVGDQIIMGAFALLRGGDSQKTPPSDPDKVGS